MKLQRLLKSSTGEIQVKVFDNALSFPAALFPHMGKYRENLYGISFIFHIKFVCETMDTISEEKQSRKKKSPVSLLKKVTHIWTPTLLTDTNVYMLFLYILFPWCC